MSSDVAAEQMAYYDARAEEYDVTAYGSQGASAQRIEAVLDDLALAGRALEIACGTGLWTRPLAARVDHLTALDTSPRSLARAAARTEDTTNVDLVQADAWTWHPADAAGFDVVFMAFWLSHVRRRRWLDFLQLATGWLAPGGRLVLVDERATNPDKESWEDTVEGEVAVRSLRDGRAFRIIKVFVDPADLARCLAAAGLRSTVYADGDWVVSSASRARR